MTITERLQKYMDYKGLNPNRITNEAGLSVGSIGRSINKNSGLSSSTIEKILKAYPDLNPEWLILEEGDMIKIKNLKFITEVHGDNNVSKNVGSSKTGDKSFNHNDLRDVVNTYNKNILNLTECLRESQKHVSELLEILKTKD
ncbi:MAG: hypothetical protein WDA08_11090 [Weeksellaceae bacterium]